MAITITSTPQSFQPVYNPAYYTVTSTNVSQAQFNFVYDVYTSSTFFATRILAPPTPSGNGIFSPMRVLENYLSYDLTNNYIGWSASTNCAMNYYIKFGESYQYVPGPGTGSTIHPNLATDDRNCWNAALGYKRLSQFQYTGYTAIYSGSPFLTYMPPSVLIQTGETASISVLMNQNLLVSTYMQINVYPQSGGSSYREYLIQDQYNTTGAPDQYINHFGSGPANINQIPSGIIGGGSNSYRPIIDPAIDAYYTLQVYITSPAGYVTQTQTYVLNCPGSQYQGVRLMWLNSLGAFDYFTFKKVDRLSSTVTPTTYRQVLPPNYGVGTRGNTVVDNLIQTFRLVNTDLIDDATSFWLSTELKNSIEAYEIQTDGTILPIDTIVFSNPESIKYMNDRTVAQYSVSYNYSYLTDVQRN